MQNRPFRLGPIALTTSAANVFNPGTTTGGTNFPALNTRAIFTHFRAVNRTGSDTTVSLFIGATGASASGTEFMWAATKVPANSAIDWFGRVPVDVADFLTGLAGASAAVTLEGDGEVGIV